MWRPAGPCREGILSYVGDTVEGFRKEGLRALATNGAQLTHQCGGLYQALVEFQGSEMRTNSELMVFANENRALFPTQYPEVMGISDQ